MKFVLFVEGHTEKVLGSFLKRWLDPRLSRPVGIKIVRSEGWNDYYGEIRTRVSLNLSGKAGADVIAGIGLLDLFGLTYPGHAGTVEARYAWARKDLEQRVDHPKFRQHFAVHETEAWLLAHPDLPVKNALPGKCAHPERVNFDDPPARLLSRLYKEKLGKPYKKVIDGSNLFQTLAPEPVTEKCPYLKWMLEEMLALAKDAGL